MEKRRLGNADPDVMENDLLEASTEVGRNYKCSECGCHVTEPTHGATPYFLEKAIPSQVGPGLNLGPDQIITGRSEEREWRSFSW